MSYLAVLQESCCPGCEYSILYHHIFVAAALIALCDHCVLQQLSQMNSVCLSEAKQCQILDTPQFQGRICVFATVVARHTFVA